MLATIYTALPIPSGEMRNGIHKDTPQGTLARNLEAAFRSRSLSARGVASAIRKRQGLRISNKTVSNMANGAGNPQLEGLMAVAKEIRIPLWQLLCPALDISHSDDDALRMMLEDYMALSELGRKRTQRAIKSERVLEEKEHQDRATSPAQSGESKP